MKNIDKLKHSYQLLKESFIEMILKFALAAEYHDPTTGVHLIRIADYTTIIAKGYGLSSPELENLRYASCMHDIGKIGVPESILRKESDLTPEEFQIMKKHTIIGARIFEGAQSQFLKIAYQVALFHHEKFDGTGYPFGFKGEDIPLYARIVSVADVFDALTSNRPYRKAIEFDKAVDFIKKHAGTFFDPHLVLIFMRNIDSIRQIWLSNIKISQFLEEAKALEENI